MKRKVQTSKGKSKTLFRVSLARHKIGMYLRRFVLLGKRSAAGDLLIKRLSIATNMAVTSCYQLLQMTWLSRYMLFYSLYLRCSKLQYMIVDIKRCRRFVLE